MDHRYLTYVALWLLLGVIADKLCEFHAKKEKRPYKRSTAVACYVAGPVILPLALCYAMLRGLSHLFGRN